MIDHVELRRRQSLSNHEAMADAQRLCAPCKLCGGAALITDAGPGFGYYIRCENSWKPRAKDACMVQDTRLSGWAYNVMELWNRQHGAPPSPVFSEWSGWDRSNLPWSQAKHQDAVCAAVFGPTWAMEDAAALIGFINMTWSTSSNLKAAASGSPPDATAPLSDHSRPCNEPGAAETIGRPETAGFHEIDIKSPSTAASERCQECDGYNCDDGCAYPDATEANGGAGG